MKNGQALLALVLASCAPYRYGGECWPVNAEIELVSSAVDKRRALTAETMRSLGINPRSVCDETVYVLPVANWESSSTGRRVAGEWISGGWGPGMAVVGADGAAMLHELLHAYQFRVERERDTGNHPGWIERGWVAAEVEFQAKATEWRAQ